MRYPILAVSLLICFAMTSWAQGGTNLTEAGQTVWNAFDFGAVPDGKTDATAALQAALDACAAAGGGQVVLPAGVYFTAGTLKVAPHVEFTGAARILDGAGEGAILLVTNREAPFITLNSRCAVEYMEFRYPEQPEAPPYIEYPWTLDCKGDNCQVIGVSLPNSYDGIRLVGAGRHLVRDVHGCPYHIGIYVDQIYDVGRIENVHFWPFAGVFRPEEPRWQWISEHGEAFIIGRTDWQYIYNCFTFGYNVGYHFIRTEAGACNGNFVGLGADYCRTAAVLVDDCWMYGLLFINGQFVAVPGDDPTAVKVSATNTGTVNFTNCASWGSFNHIANIEGKGFVSFNNCNFMHWDKNKRNRAAIRVAGGNLTVTGCQFMMPMRKGSPQVSIEQGAQAVTIGLNTSETPWNIKNTSDIEPEVGLNSARIPAP
jgi:hypothetical protein